MLARSGLRSKPSVRSRPERRMSWRTFGLMALATTVGVTVGGLILGTVFIVVLGSR